MSTVLESLKRSLDRTVPISDPDYIVGEKESLSAFGGWVKSCMEGQQGFIGTVILGQIGNGKTHFLRFIRKNEKENMIGIYIPNMFISGPLVDALNDLYKSFFYAPGNNSLKSFYSDWEKFKNASGELTIEGYGNQIFRYLLRCNNKEEAEVVLDYFSGLDLFPDQLKFLKNKFGARKSFIVNEIDFAQASGDALQFIQLVSEKPILLLFDEVDKVYSFETNSVTLTRVGSRILTSYRALFDHLNTKNLRGIVCVGATPEAWDVLSKQTAFERRFKDRKLLLKVPKTKEDCLDFAINRLEEINYSPNPIEVAVIKDVISDLNEERLKTWADVISLLRTTQENKSEMKVTEDPAVEILGILDNSIVPLTWAKILERSTLLQKMYPKSQPTPVLNKLVKEGKVIVSSGRPKTYESSSLSEEF
ncbi:hypothetical protein BS614_02535 [Paenibacillus xylanexedens]|uniref:hypothetical protein n=1 Tax=Paenibacillus xylanexedens TaxID=528191 RepID=UPI00093837D5|nr:hypothetical protein [Paenibacillus xylanexedens]APO43051.1 hypothetical protein BS614_02535 [Paenibacillus xylanexedens]